MRNKMETKRRTGCNEVWTDEWPLWLTGGNMEWIYRTVDTRTHTIYLFVFGSRFSVLGSRSSVLADTPVQSAALRKLLHPHLRIHPNCFVRFDPSPLTPFILSISKCSSLRLFLCFKCSFFPDFGFIPVFISLLGYRLIYFRATQRQTNLHYRWSTIN